jgi:gamma-glutamyl-gamma-aminobutyrate hydrolase PuuD
MTTWIGVTQRVVAGAGRDDVLDQSWTRFLAHCGLTPLPLPNDADTARRIVTGLPVTGLLLTGGNYLGVCGGDAPERDATEHALVDLALRRDMPLIGVCRGMQVLQHHFGVPLHRVTGHVSPSVTLTVDGRPRAANSFHNWAATTTVAPLRAWVSGTGGVVKAVRHETAPLVGIMWHPERMTPFTAEDEDLFRRAFQEES